MEGIIIEKNKKGFSLIELVFVIAVMAIIAAFAVPRLMDSKSNAIITSLKQDISTITNSIQSHYMLNDKIEKISDAVTLNESRWLIEDQQVTYKIDGNNCIMFKIISGKIELKIDPASSDFCQKLKDGGIIDQTYDLF